MVCLDKFGQVRDFYFPYVGQEDHVGPNQEHKIGVFADGKMNWFDDGSWDIDIRFVDFDTAIQAKPGMINEKPGIRGWSRMSLAEQKRLLGNIFSDAINLEGSS